MVPFEVVQWHRIFERSFRPTQALRDRTVDGTLRMDAQKGRLFGGSHFAQGHQVGRIIYRDVEILRYTRTDIDIDLYR